mgnify:CR=1 FL=1
MPAAASARGLTSVVVVTADSGAIVRECVQRVLASSAAVELVLVDNASTDGEPETVLAGHAGDARLRMLHNARNLGFGTACNRGAALARGDALLFLNPDCLLEADTIERLRGVLARHADAGLVGVCVEDGNGRPERAVHRREPTLRRSLMTLSGLARFERRFPALAGVAVPAGTDDPGEIGVEAVSGACMFLPRAAFDAVGGFDEGYFLHAEDLDLCRRLRDAGWKVLLAGGIRVRHEQGSSSRHRAGFVARHKQRSLWRYFTRHDPAARNPLLRACVCIGLVLHHLAGMPRRAWRRRRGS